MNCFLSNSLRLPTIDDAEETSSDQTELIESTLDGIVNATSLEYVFGAGTNPNVHGKFRIFII